MDILQYLTMLESIFAQTDAIKRKQRHQVYAKARQLVVRRYPGARFAALRAEELEKLEVAISQIEGCAGKGGVLDTFRLKALIQTLQGASHMADDDYPMTDAARSPFSSAGETSPYVISGEPDTLEPPPRTWSLGPRLLIPAVILLAAASVIGVLGLRPEIDRPETPKFPAIQPANEVSQPIVSLGRMNWRSRLAHGDVNWTRETDQSSLASRRNRRSIITGRLNLSPLSGTLTIYFVPLTSEGLKASHLLEMNFEPAGPKSVRALEAVKFGEGHRDAEGVIIKTGPNAFAYAFSQGEAASALNLKLLRDVRLINVTLGLDTGERHIVTIPLPPLLD